MFARRAVIVVIVTLAIAGSARADNKDQARVHVQAADIDYKLGKFDEALAEYSKAFELFPAPPLLFNLAQCHRNLKNFERAIFFFEGYLRESPNAPNRALVEDLLKESRAALDQQRSDEAARKAADDARLRAATEEAHRHMEDDARRRQEEDRRAAEARRKAEADDAHGRKFYQRWWFWSAVGGATLALGGTAYYFSGSTTTVDPMGTLGGLDRR
jgi:tetratricopeptide (TPR) repeat protein